MTRMYESHNHVLIQPGYGDPKKHRHMAAHIIISMDGEMAVAANGTSYRCKGILIPSGVSHAIDTMGSALLVFLYDCTTSVARQIKDTLCISDEICNHIIAFEEIAPGVA